MISLVLAMVWSRRGQAVTLALLALFAVASAVASPAYLAAADRAVAAGQIATATAAERGLIVTASQDQRQDDGAPDFVSVGAALVKLPGFNYIYAAQFPAIGIEKTNRYPSQIVFRQDVCSHVRLVAGRCLIGEGDVIIGSGTAKRLGLAAGDPVTMTFATFNDDDRDPLYLPDGLPAKLVVAGVYEVPDQTGIYWGTHGYFTAVGDRGPGEPVFAGEITQAAFLPGRTEMSIDGNAGPGALAVDNLPALRAGLGGLLEDTPELGPTIQINTAMPALLDRIDAGRGASRLLVPVLAVPLVLLACFSIFLAVGYGTQGRQPELAVVALRGSRWWTKWWLATGESLVAIVLGAVAGCLAGQLLVNAVAAARFPGVGTDPGFASLRYAPLAALAALAAAVLAQRRQLLSPVATLLRRHPVTANGPRAFAVEALVVLLAVLSAVQLAVSGGELTGVGVLAPAFVVLALALLAARALLPLVTRYASRALAAGRPGPALAAFQLSRRPGAQRLFALLVATVAVAGYAASAVDVAARGRTTEAYLGVGADRVVSVQPVFRSRLLHAVQEIDPDGDFAMAVARLPNNNATEPRGLAVDATRLAAVANWPGGGPSAPEVARDLRPESSPPLVLSGRDLSIVATATGVVKGRELRLHASVSSLTGLGDSRVDLGDLHNGRWTYQQRIEECAQGCRLDGLQLTIAGAVVAVRGSLVIQSLGTVNPAKPVPAAELADAARWRMPRDGTVTATPQGLRIDVDAAAGLPNGAWVNPVSAPYPLPLAYAGAAPAGDLVTGLDGFATPVTFVDDLPAVPRLGVQATLVDLEFADRLAIDATPALLPEVWLNDKAPADILDRLSQQGLTVTGDEQSSQIRRQLDEQGPALALWFYVLAGTLAVLLGGGALVLAAAVDRERRVEDLSALRVQGLSGPTVDRATLWTYPALVAIATVAGTLTALAAWAVTGWALPLAGLNPPDLPLPSWPGLLPLAGTAVVVLLVLVVIALATGRDLRRRIEP
jgi:putative ABC transport system permease protein